MAANDDHQGKTVVTQADLDGYGNTLGTDLVTIHVGSGHSKRTFCVHKNLICNKIDYFKKMFEGGFKEGIEQTANFPEEKRTFDLLLEWLYKGEITLYPGRKRYMDGPRIGKIADLHVLAHKICHDALQDYTMTIIISIIAMHYQPGWVLCLSILGDYANKVASTSPLRIFYAKLVAFAIVSGAHETVNYSTEQIHWLLRDDQELLFEVLKHLRTNGDRSDPCIFATCKFHVHAPGQPCLYQNRI